MVPTRTAAASELDEIYRMGFDAWGEGRGLDVYLAACRATPKYAAGAWWVHASEEGRLESSLLAHEIPLPLGAPAMGLGSIAVPPALRGQGHASRLIRDVISRYEEAAGTGVFFLFSDILPAFYERFGFTALGPCPGKPASILMARAGQEKLSGLLAHPKFKPPDYF